MATILIIDDSASIRAALESALSQAGHRILTAENGKQGMKIVRAQQDLDLIVTDIYMPEEDGLEVIKQTRQLREDLPIIAMSAKTGPANMFRVAVNFGRVSLLQKPFSMDQLIASVNKALNRSLET